GFPFGEEFSCRIIDSNIPSAKSVNYSFESKLAIKVYLDDTWIVGKSEYFKNLTLTYFNMKLNDCQVEILE
ncbi:hypothetical protein V7317_18575, partial [Bacillus velezensis]